ncbi:pseudouridine synthase [Stagnimonas aquatica]|uniref:Pseudouridine synthase n=1 Tax=Stagnimonas aquatica TaxID=2689987 RepID=A0A3N0VEC8_9GAMM|nr:pseudouridine synthase [Stagnimonas aquatica]ROH91109.1 pseudouridine synthase [Stagnimonas aquatica]
MSERIQKYLSNLGYGSRREVEDWIVEGRLVVNGQPAEIGQKIDESDAVKLDGKRLSLKGGNEPLKVLIYKKRTGEMVTREDPEGRRTVFRKLPDLETGRWIAVGRLDVNTSGLLLMTNHGELARRLMHPSFEQKREYAVRALGELPEGFMQRLQSGVQLEDGPAHFETIRFGDNEIEDDESEGEGSGGRANHWFVVTITEGRHREVRRLFESQGLTVNRLIRTGYGPIKLGRGIKSGSYREATRDEIHKLLDAVGMDHSEALPERVRESHRAKSEFPQGGKPKAAGPKPQFKSGAEGWSKASRDERKQVERTERFEKKRDAAAPGPARAASAYEAGAKPRAGKPSPWRKEVAGAVPAGGGEPQQFKARGFGAKSERSYAERGDSAPPPRRRETGGERPYAPRGEAAGRPVYGKKPYGERGAAGAERPAYKPRAAREDGAARPAYAKKPYGERPARAGEGERPAFKPRFAREESGARPAYGKKPYGERAAAGGERPAYKPRAAREDGAVRPAYGKNPYGERPARAGEGERPAFKPRLAREDGAARPAYAKKAYGERPAGARPFGKPAGEGGGYRGSKPDAARAPKKNLQRFTVRDGQAASGNGKPKLGLRGKKKGDED